jgi:transposase-like protein
MILAMDRGTSPSTVARTLKCDRNTVYYWLRRYLKHRDPSDLSNGQSGITTKRLCQQARELNAMKGGEGRHKKFLKWEKTAKHILKLDAKFAPDPYARRLAAILWAIDRGVSIAQVARLCDLSRATIYRFWNHATSITPDESKKRPETVKLPTDICESARME